MQVSGKDDHIALQSIDFLKNVTSPKHRYRHLTIGGVKYLIYVYFHVAVTCIAVFFIVDGLIVVKSKCEFDQFVWCYHATVFCVSRILVNWIRELVVPTPKLHVTMSLKTPTGGDERRSGRLALGPLNCVI